MVGRGEGVVDAPRRLHGRHEGHVGYHRSGQVEDMPGTDQGGADRRRGRRREGEPSAVRQGGGSGHAASPERVEYFTHPPPEVRHKFDTYVRRLWYSSGGQPHGAAGDLFGKGRIVFRCFSNFKNIDSETEVPFFWKIRRPVTFNCCIF
jgi:hypothetical protein